ncbi:MAG: SDR family oxidoreductase [Vampirovibrionales bacterium]
MPQPNVSSSIHTSRKDAHTHTAVVFGASSGLGKASAEALAHQGYAVVTVARSEKTLCEQASSFQPLTPSGILLPCAGDLEDSTQWDTLPLRIAEVLAHHFNHATPLYPAVVVHNSGGPPAGNTQSFDLTQWEKAWQHQCLRVIALDQHFIPAMVAQGYGRWIAVTSVAVAQPVPYLALSNVSRAGLTGYMKSLSHDVATQGITVNAVAPGLFSTTRLQSLFAKQATEQHITPEAYQAQQTQHIPMQRLGTPEEFAHAVTFLASPQASYITGTTLHVDGGLHKALI